jgi:hypothetical protein
MLSDNARISGARALYFIDLTSLPREWCNDVVWDRHFIEGSTGVLERVNFWMVTPSRPVLTRTFMPLFSIYVMDRNIINEADIPFAIVTRSKDYIVAIRYASPVFDNDFDMLSFNIKLSPIDNENKARRFISFPPGQQIDYRNTVFINGIPMNAPSLLIEGTRFIQLREASNMLGYNVRWDDTMRWVTISLGMRIIEFSARDLMDGRTHEILGVSMRLVDGRIYVSPVFFSWFLGIKSSSFEGMTGNLSLFS